jgi:hypothetical protein
MNFTYLIIAYMVMTLPTPKNLLDTIIGLIFIAYAIVYAVAEHLESQRERAFMKARHDALESLVKTLREDNKNE